MKTLSKIILIIIISFSVGCKTTKETSESSNIVKKDSIVYNLITKDSIVIKTEEVVTPGNNTNINLENPCDSLGNLKPMDLTTSVGKSKLKIIFKDNKIKIEAINDSIKSVFKSEYTYKLIEKDSIIKSLSEKNTSLIQKSKTTKFNWWFLFSVVLNVFLVAFCIKLLSKV